MADVGIIDADLLDGGTRYPNLALMKISQYEKNEGNDVKLILAYEDSIWFDKIYLSKVFVKTQVPIDLAGGKISYGGTGFFLEKAPDLPPEIEHSMPDYSLYADHVANLRKKDANKGDIEAYTEASIGFTTRGCFRKCSFCINRKYDHVFRHSPVAEFSDKDRRYISLLDDNILAYPGWREVLDELDATNKPYQYKQGMDIRLMTKDKAARLAVAKYNGDFIFAFDNVSEEAAIRKGLSLWREYSSKRTKLYVLCAYDSMGVEDIEGVFYRIKVLMEYGCTPYLMRYEGYEKSEFRGMYIALAKWCNQPALFKKMSFEEFVAAHPEGSTIRRYSEEFLSKNPNFPTMYYKMKFEKGGQT